VTTATQSNLKAARHRASRCGLLWGSLSISLHSTLPQLPLYYFGDPDFLSGTDVLATGAICLDLGLGVLK